ncbi:hypothetical protein ACFT5D_21880 [Streptomyces sp. NPDC057144]|uniref:hypothetical protein n=1 Tax=unclassified Streptomyces TaxID=2593676 RepID=UPI003408035D
MVDFDVQDDAPRSGSEPGRGQEPLVAYGGHHRRARPGAEQGSQGQQHPDHFRVGGVVVARQHQDAVRRGRSEQREGSGVGRRARTADDAYAARHPQRRVEVRGHHGGIAIGEHRDGPPYPAGLVEDHLTDNGEHLVGPAEHHRVPLLQHPGPAPPQFFQAVTQPGRDHTHQGGYVAEVTDKIPLWCGLDASVANGVQKVCAFLEQPLGFGERACSETFPLPCVTNDCGMTADPLSGPDRLRRRRRFGP